MAGTSQELADGDHNQPPEGNGKHLRRQYPDLVQAAKEALLILAYRDGRISAGGLAKVPELETSLLALEWLHERGEPLNFGLDDLEADWRTLEQMKNAT